MHIKIILCIFALVATALSFNSVDELKPVNDQFTARMFQEVVQNNQNQSCVISAFSVLPPLTQLGLASIGKTHDEIFTAIGFHSDGIAKEVFSDLNKKMLSIKGVELKQANKIYIRKNYTLNYKFAAMTKDIFDSDVQNIDLYQPEKAANEINEWIEDHTNKRIQGLMDAKSIKNETVAILVNAIYFKGNWTKPFVKGSTIDRDFRVTPNRKITVPMMYQENHLKYLNSQELDAQIIELEYKGGETSLIIALPNKIDGIHKLIEKLKNPDALNKAIDAMSTQEVLVYLPKFKIETTTDLVDVLEKMNIKSLFDAFGAQLVKLLKEPANLYISSATQKTFIEVNEAGTEAAAANQFSAGVGASFNPHLKIFEADHPFAFFLMMNKIILFNGVFQS